jgi:Uncharacterised protein family (UPF0149)
MNTPLTPTEFTHLDACLSHDRPLSMLDGYLAAVASGPVLRLPDQVLRWLWGAGHSSDEILARMVIRYYSSVNDALNDQVYVPRLTSVRAWCRGYLAGFAEDMFAWTPLLSTQPELLKLVVSGAEGRLLDCDQDALATVAGRIHAFWFGQHQRAMDSKGILVQLSAMSPSQAVLPELLH